MLSSLVAKKGPEMEDNVSMCACLCVCICIYVCLFFLPCVRIMFLVRGAPDVPGGGHQTHSGELE